MQFANDITPLTLASTAKLRETIKTGRNEIYRAAAQQELVNRHIQQIRPRLAEELEYIRDYVDVDYPENPTEHREVMKSFDLIEKFVAP